MENRIGSAHVLSLDSSCVNYTITRITASAKLIPCSSCVTHCPGWRDLNFKSESLPWLGVFKYLIQCHCTGWGHLNQKWWNDRTWQTDRRTQPFIVKDENHDIAIAMSPSRVFCVSVCVSVTSFDHFWFKYPQSRQWHWYKYLNTPSQGSDTELNI